MNATQLASVLQKVKTDPVLQETLRVTKQDWVELNLTTLESLQASMNITSAPEFSDEELEITGSCYRCYTSRKASVIKTCECE
jgi:hypothetical protein